MSRETQSEAPRTRAWLRRIRGRRIAGAAGTGRLSHLDRVISRMGLLTASGLAALTIPVAALAAYEPAAIEEVEPLYPKESYRPLEIVWERDPVVLLPEAPPPPAATPATPPSLDVEGNLSDSGVASTYGVGDGFQGNTTACGDIFDTNLMTAAHKTLPCGTRVRVVDADSGRSVVVSINDRGPFTPGRVIDLSMAAYRQIDPSGQPGVRDVRVYRLP